MASAPVRRATSSIASMARNDEVETGGPMDAASSAARTKGGSRSGAGEQSGGEASAKGTVPSSSQSVPKVTPPSPGAGVPMSRSNPKPGTVKLMTSQPEPHSTSPGGSLVTPVQSPRSTSRSIVVHLGRV